MCLHFYPPCLFLYSSFYFSLSFFISFQKNTFSSTYFKSFHDHLSSTIFTPNHNHDTNKFKTISQFISYRYPVVSQIVSSSKNLQTIPIRDQFLNVFVNLCRLLTLAPSFTKNDVFCYTSLDRIQQISFNSHQTSLFCMLQVKSMAFGDFSINRLFNPCNRVNDFVAPYFFHQIDGKSIFCIDSPNDKKATIFLKLRDWNFFNILVIEAVILNGNTSGRLRRWEFPWRVHHDNVEIWLADLKLFFDQIIKVELGDIGANGDGVLTNLGRFVWNNAKITNKFFLFLDKVRLVVLNLELDSVE